MSASFFWQPTGGGKGLGVSSPSQFKTAIERTFGTLPVILNESSVSILRAMAAVAGDSSSANSYDDLAEAIEKHGEIRLWAEY